MSNIEVLEKYSLVDLRQKIEPKPDRRSLFLWFFTIKNQS